MIRILCLLFSSFFILASDNDPKQPVTSFIVADTISTQIYLNNDTQGLANEYHARIFTPVCETERCYAIELDFRWNLIGDFVGYDTLPGKELTKLDHVPFTGNDYKKLQDILLNENSALGAYKKDELIENTRTSELDGITGATAREIKNSVINGAVYSCYTLWHIAHGPVVDSIQKSTMNMLSGDLVKKLVDQEDIDVNYFLINHFSDEEFGEYLSEILLSMKIKQGYYVKKAIERMPSDLFLNVELQTYFIENFEKMDYFSQVAMLKGLSGKKIVDDLKTVLNSNLTERNSLRNELIREILDNN